MIAFSFPAPRHGDRGGVVVVLVLGPENLERMKQGDPFDLQYERYWAVGERAREIDLIVCYEKDQAAVTAFHEANDIGGLMRYLERGRRHRAGDAEPPVKMERNL